MLEEIREKLKNVTISGENLSTVNDASFDLISNHFHQMSDEERRIINYWENWYLELFSKLKNGEVPITPLETRDGHVVIDIGHPFHRLSAKMDTLRSISTIGIVASEWFGIPESENEGPCCAFIDQVQKILPDLPTPEDRDYSNKKFTAIKNNRFAFAYNPYNATFFFDKNNPIMQLLASYDFFEYLKMKKNNPEQITNFYPKEVIELFDKICDAEKLSKRYVGRFHDDGQYRTKTWLAIPMGIPPFLINGICINSNSELMSHLDEISSLFPNAIIFNENKEIIREPLLGGQSL